MNIIFWIVIGLIAGWLANAILGGRGGLLGNLAVGLVGAVLGGVLLGALHIIPEANFVGQLVSATIGALVFLLIWRAIRRA
ncbi:MAG: GlsB/YeaQ/YmgE family stress response membrane protein [Pseudolabrys sp.]|jgi:uncharacterized membrane protein YeaQ/YmgE (transglycosylase-associated protein family)